MSATRWRICSRRPVAIHAEDRSDIQDALSRAGAGDEVKGEARVIAKDGRIVHVEYRAHPERNPDGNLAGVLGAFRDVSLERQQQTALAAERQRLLVDISKRQEVEAEFRKSKEEAERRANEAEEARAAVKDREQRLHYEAQLKTIPGHPAHDCASLSPLLNVAEILRPLGAAQPARHAPGVMDADLHW